MTRYLSEEVTNSVWELRNDGYPNAAAMLETLAMDVAEAVSIIRNLKERAKGMTPIQVLDDAAAWLRRQEERP